LYASEALEISLLDVFGYVSLARLDSFETEEMYHSLIQQQKNLCCLRLLFMCLLLCGIRAAKALEDPHFWKFSPNVAA